MNIELGEVQLRFAQIIWEREPVPSGELVKIAKEEFMWKKPTTYTVLRTLCQKGLFENVDGIVRAKITEEQFKASKGEQLIQESFDGSLPAFVSAFVSNKGISQSEIDEIQDVIRKYQESQKK